MTLILILNRNFSSILEPKNYQLAQHAYIKALNADKTSAVAWANLGTLYLILGELVLANKAFSEAQRHDPGYVNSWIGQVRIKKQLQRRKNISVNHIY